jgi:hypothetical protein
MIYIRPSNEDRLDQGDLLDNFPLMRLEEYQLSEPSFFKADATFRRVVVLTQACDLALAKTR